MSCISQSLYIIIATSASFRLARAPNGLRFTCAAEAQRRRRQVQALVRPLLLEQALRYFAKKQAFFQHLVGLFLSHRGCE